MKKRLPVLIILLFLLLLQVSPALSQSDYSFQVNSAVVNFYVNKDGTASVEYTYNFTNNPGAHPIDFVDIGLPNDNYDLGSITAEVNGKKITDIQKSTFVSHGIALGLGDNTIPAGASGQVYAWVPIIRGVINPASSSGKPDYASVQFSPNYFDSKYVTGSTNLTISTILPPGMSQSDPIYYPPQNWPGNSQPESGISKDGRVFYTWQSPSANSSTEYIFGAGFPAKLVPAASIVKPPVININPGLICFLGFGLFIILIIWLSISGSRRRRLQYLSPKISMEGHGIKRGLTAVEVAVLMQQPVDKVLTLILFAVVKKGAAKVVSRDPLNLQVLSPLPTGLYPYETEFLTAFQTAQPAARRKALQDVIVGLVKSVTEKMRGFSLKETLAYYESIMQQAWQQVEAAQTPEVKSQKFDEVMDWTMLDRNYGDRTRNVFRTGPVFVPMWWGNWDPGYHGGGMASSSMPSSGSSSGGGGGGGGISLPTLPGADFAASMVNGVQSFAAGAIGDLGAFTGAVTNQTNPPPPPPKTTYHGGGGGGHSCACACACAGCACACAGGGR
jgi:hypothetical protein